MKPHSQFAAILLVLGAVATDAAATPACFDRTFEASRFTVCTADTQHQDIRLALTGPDGKPLRSFYRLAAQLGGASVRFAMNAGMFESDGSPVGLYVENGTAQAPLNTRTGSGNFYMKPNGVFWLDKAGAAHVDPTEHFAPHRDAAIWATQSGPMLVLDGQINPQVSPDGSSKFIRNGVGIRDEHTVIFAISDEPVSFGRFARFFRDDQNCADALYFDGAVSSLWAPSLDRKDTGHPLGPLVVVTDR